MPIETQKSSQDEGAELRREAGRYLRDLREKAGLSQRLLAKAVGLEYYTFISQIEAGRGRIPAPQLPMWAKVLGVPAHEFGKQMLRFYDPVSYDMIFGDAAPLSTSESPRPNDTGSLEARILHLEQLVGLKR